MVRGLTLNGIKVPLLQYFLGDVDYKLIYTLYTKEKRKVIYFQIFTFIAGTRRTTE